MRVITYSHKTRDEEVYTYILKLAVSGISKLTETYSKTDRKSISHTLNLYKNVLELDTPDLFKDTNSNSIDIDTVFQNITTIYPPALVKIIFSILNLLMLKNKPNKIFLKLLDVLIFHKIINN